MSPPPLLRSSLVLPMISVSLLFLSSFTVSALSFAQLFEEFETSTPSPCTYGKWSGWSLCSCGSLTKYRTRNLNEEITLFKSDDPDALADCKKDGGIESQEVSCPRRRCDCRDTRKDCLANKAGRKRDWCSRSDDGDKNEKGTWANWLRRFCAKSCNLCGAGEGPAKSEEEDGEWDDERCACGEWKVERECQDDMCGLCGRRVSTRKCRSEKKCWSRREETCDDNETQKAKCPGGSRRRTLKKRKDGVWRRMRPTGCCNTSSPFGKSCDPLGNRAQQFGPPG